MKKETATKLPLFFYSNTKIFARSGSASGDGTCDAVDKVVAGVGGDFPGRVQPDGGGRGGARMGIALLHGIDLVGHPAECIAAAQKGDQRFAAVF